VLDDGPGAAGHELVDDRPLLVRAEVLEPGANLSIVSHKTSVEKIYNAMISLARFGNKKYFPLVFRVV
jgi:hypothetical protein